MLILAAVLCVFIGVVHSYRGERFILIRLFRKPLPPLCGNDHFTRKTLRLAWHITTVAWCNFCRDLALHITGAESRRHILFIIGRTFDVSAVFPIFASRGKHSSWIVFGAIAVLCFVAGNAGALLSHTDTLSVTLICRPQFARCGNELYSLRLRFRRHNAILES